MSVSYSVHLIYGFELKEKDCKVIIEPAVYDNQKRYDPKTGKVTHTEKVLVKHQEFKYVWGNIESTPEVDDFWPEFLETISKKLKLSAFDDNRSGTAVIGKAVFKNEDYGRFDAPTGSVSLESLGYTHNNLMEQLIKNNIEIDPTELKLRIVTWIG